MTLARGGAPKLLKGLLAHGSVLLIASGCGPTHKVIPSEPTGGNSASEGGTSGGDGRAGNPINDNGETGISGTAGPSVGGTGIAGGPNGAAGNPNPFLCSPMPVCGNGVAEESKPADFTCREQCDGMDLRGSTCESIGYQSGALSCASTCGFDTSNCERCGPLDAHLLACHPDIQGGSGVALAATDTAIALAFVQDEGLWFETLAPDLSISTASHRVASGSFDVIATDLIATSDGWALVVLGKSLDLYTLDTSGKLVSKSVLREALTIRPQVLPGQVQLVRRSTGGLFVLWQSGDAGDFDLNVLAVAPDGSAIAAPVKIGRLSGSVVAAATTPSGALIAASLATTPGSALGDLFTVQIDATGAPVGQPTRVDQFGGFPTMATTSDGGVVLAYDGLDPLVTEWIKLDETGVPQASPAAIDGNLFHFAPTIMPMADGGYLAITDFFRDAKGAEHGGVRSLQISEAGNVTAPGTVFIKDPTITSVRAARCGSEVVVAWGALDDSHTHRFGLARIAP